jgi:hypothetical protein
MKFKSFKKLAAGLVLCAFAFAWFLPVLEAQPQFPPRTVNFATNLVITNGQTLTVPSNAVPVWPGRGMAILPYFAATNTTTDPMIFRFTASVDGVNWTTVTPINITNTLASTTAVRGYHQITPFMLDHARFLRLWQVVNAHTSSIFVTNVVGAVYPVSQ